MNEGEYLNLDGRSDQDMFDVKRSIRSVMDAVRKYRVVVYTTCLLTLALATWYLYVWPPIYRVDAAIMAEKDTDNSRDAFYGSWNVFRKDDARTEIELMTSVPVLKQVIEKEHLKWQDVYHPFMSQISFMWETSFIGRNYKLIKNKLFPDKDLEGISPEDQDLARTIDDLAAGITVQPVGESNVARVTVKGPSQRVSGIANTLIDSYLAMRAQRYQTEAQRSFDILSKEADEASVELASIDHRREKYSAQNGLVFDLQKETMQLKQLTDLEANIAATHAKIAEIRASLNEANRQLAAEPETRTVSATHELNAVRETTKLRKLELETSLIQAMDRYHEGSPEVRDIRGDIAKMEALLSAQPEQIEKGSTEGLNAVREELLTTGGTLRVQLDGALAGLYSMEGTAAQMRRRLQEVPTLQAELHEMDRDYGLAQEKYQALSVKQAEASVSLATATAAMPSVRVVGYAVPPGGKYWPRLKILYPAALFLGAFLGVCGAVVASYASGTVQREHLEYGRGSARIYGAISVRMDDRPLDVHEKPKSRAASSHR
jgi:uncharacterized protein involved in exopolysaccharide biosynthesis